MLLYNVFKMCLAACFMSATMAKPSDITHKTLDNGLNIVIKEDHRHPIAYITFSYKVGSIQEPAYQTGISHFLEHVMYGRTNNLSHTNIEDFYNQHSGHYNATTSFEQTQYTTSVLPSEVASVLRFEKDRLTNLQFLEADIEKERKVILQEKSQRLSQSPWSEPKELFHVLSFPTGGYHHPIMGWESDIKTITPHDLQAWYQNWYQPQNLTILVVGDVQTEKVVDNIKMLFEDIPSHSTNQTMSLNNKNLEGDMRIDVKRPVNNPLYIISFQTPKPEKDSLKSEITLSLLEDLLTNQQQGLISQGLVTNNHLAVEVSSELDYLKKINGYFSFYIVPNKNIHFYSIKNKLLSLLNNISEEDITDQRFLELKKRYLAQHVFYQDSLDYQSKILSKLISIDLPYNRYNEATTVLEKITKKDLVSTLRTHFNEDSPKAILTVKPL